MSKNEVIVGIDIGSSNVRTVVAQIFPEEELPRVVGVGIAPAEGMRHGVIIDIDEAVRSIKESIRQAEMISGVRINSATVSLGGSHITSQSSKGVVAVGRADGEVEEDDVERVINAAQAISIPPNKEIVHVIPCNYSLDEQKNIKDPLGMNGVRLEADTLIIEGSAPHIKNLVKCFEQAGIAIRELVLAPLSASKAVLSKRQKELGVVLVDIGGGTTSLAVYEENELLHTGILPFGGSNITNDVAIGLRTSIDVAEKVKIEFGSVTPKEISKKDEIDLSQIDTTEEGCVSRQHVAEIMEARLEEIFTLVNKELKAIGRERLLPAGVVLVGGGAKVPGAVDLAKNVLGLPTQVGFPVPLGGLVDKVDDPAFASTVGLLLWELENGGEGNNVTGFFKDKMSGMMPDWSHDWLKKIKKTFLP